MKIKSVKRMIEWVEDKEIGRYRTWVTRLGGYLTPINFTLILYGFIILEPLGIKIPFWLMAVIIGVPCVMLVDVLIVLPSELKYAFKKNKRLVDMDKKLDRVEVNQKIIMDALKILN